MAETPVMLGGWLSTTVTVKLQVALGATPFEAVQLTMVEPTLNVCGDVITAFVSVLMQTIVGVGTPVALTLNETEAEHPGPALTTMGLVGHVVKTGGVPTWMVTSACEDGQGGLDIVHRSFIWPLPPVCVNVALGVVALGLNVPVAPTVTIDHMPVPMEGVLPPSGAVVPPGVMV